MKRNVVARRMKAVARVRLRMLRSMLLMPRDIFLAVMGIEPRDQ